MFEQVAPMTAEQFGGMALHSDEKRMEVSGGDNYVLPTTAYSSNTAGLILTYIDLLVMKDDIAHVTGGADTLLGLTIPLRAIFKD